MWTVAHRGHGLGSSVSVAFVRKGDLLAAANWNYVSGAHGWNWLTRTAATTSACTVSEIAKRSLGTFA